MFKYVHFEIFMYIWFNDAVIKHFSDFLYFTFNRKITV